MQIIKNKKGLSDTLSMVLSVIGVIVAVAILALSIQQLSRNILESPEFNCIDAGINPPIRIIGACYNSGTSDLNIEVQRTIQNTDIRSLEFIVNTGTNTETFFCSETCSDCQILRQGKKTYYLTSETQPTRVTLRVNQCVLETTDTIRGC